MITEESQGKRADIQFWKDRIVFTALSGRGLLRDDPDAFQRVLSRDAQDHELSASLQSALLSSRFLADNEALTFMQYDKAAWEGRVAHTAAAAGATSARAFLKGLVKVWVAQRAGVITFTPTRRLRGPAWEGIAEAGSIEAPSHAESAIVAAAIRHAASLCVA